MRILIASIYLLSASALIGCTRDVETTQVTLPIPSSQKVSSLAANTARSHIFINISGPGIEDKIIRTWSDKCGLNCIRNNPAYSGTAPDSITIQVPSGEDRLVQYLEIWTHNDTKGSFYSYGDNDGDLATLSPGDQTITITTVQTPLPDAGAPDSGLKQNLITGQYVNGALGGTGTFGPQGTLINGYGHGYTDRVNVIFKPTNSTQTMTVGYSEIFNGWFNFTAFDGVELEYQLASTGLALNINYKDLSQEIALGAVPLSRDLAMSKYINPGFYWGRGHIDSNIRTKSVGGDIIFGFFGGDYTQLQLGGEKAQACHYGGGGAIDLLSTLWEDLLGSGHLQWSEFPADMNVVDVYRLNGGEVVTTCVDSGNKKAFVNRILIDPYDLQYGKWLGAGFYGPFQIIKDHNFTYAPCSSLPTNDDYQLTEGNSCYNANAVNTSDRKIKYQWQYINDSMFHMTGAIDGVSLFVKPIPLCTTTPCARAPWSDYQNIYGGTYCNNLTQLGFTKIADFNSTNHNFDGLGYANFEALPFFDATQYQPMSFVCPFKLQSDGSKKYFTFAARIKNLNPALP